MRLALKTYYTSISALRNAISKSGKQIKIIITNSKNIKRGLRYKSRHHHLSTSEAITASIQAITEKDTWVGYLVVLFTTSEFRGGWVIQPGGFFLR